MSKAYASKSRSGAWTSKSSDPDRDDLCGPSSTKISEELKQQAWRENNWQEVGSIAQTPGSASYRIQELPGMMEGIPYRFIVVNSSSLDKRREKSLIHEIEKEEQRLTKALIELAKITYACRPYAQKAMNHWLTKQKARYHQLQVTVTEETLPKSEVAMGDPAAEKFRLPKGFTASWEPFLARMNRPFKKRMT